MGIVISFKVIEPLSPLTVDRMSSVGIVKRKWKSIVKMKAKDNNSKVLKARVSKTTS